MLAFTSKTPQKVNTKQRKSVVNLFFATIGTQSTCVEVKGIRMFFVSSRAPVAVKVYEFEDKGLFLKTYETYVLDIEFNFRTFHS